MSRRLLALLVATLLLGAGLAVVFLMPAPEEGTRKPTAFVPSATAENRVELRVTEKGFEPAAVRIQGNRPVTLVVTRTTEQTCATELVIPGSNVRVALPLGVPVSVTFPAPKSGTLRYACGMGMLSGALLVE